MKLRLKYPPHTSNEQAFSLIEIVLALAITSFALVGILGLFPLALDGARDSKAETLVALIGQSLLADIEGTKPASPVSTGTPPVSSSDVLIHTAATPATLDLLMANTSLYFSYDDQGLCEAAITENEFVSGVPSSTYLVKLTSNYAPSEYPGLTRLVMSMEYPAAAPEINRQKRTFFRLIRP